MNRISGATIANYICSLIWIITGIAGICNGSPYASSYYKFFAAIWFAAIGTYYLLVGLDKIKPFSKKRKAIIGVTGLAFVLAVFFICIGNYTVETYKHNVKSEKIPEGFDGFRIVQVSDLHNAEFDKYNATVLEPVFNAKPDIIVITGDLIDSRNIKVDAAISFAQKAVNIAPVYYINGNHEARVPDEYEKLKQGLTDAGVTILENDSIDITIGDEAITLIGINDPAFRMKLVDDTMEQNIAHQLTEVIPDNDNYKVLLAHRPHYFNAYSHILIDEIDLVDKDDLDEISSKNKQDIVEMLVEAEIEEFAIVEVDKTIKHNEKSLSMAPQVGDGEVTRYFLLGKKDGEYKIIEVYWEGFMND